MVDEFAATSPPTISPTKPTGKNFSIAGYAMSCPSNAGSRFGNAFWMSESCGYTMIEQRATRIHGQGRRT